MKIYDKAYFYFRHHIAISFLLEETIHQVFEIKKNLRTCHSYLIYNFFMLYVVYSSNILYMTFSLPVVQADPGFHAVLFLHVVVL